MIRRLGLVLLGLYVALVGAIVHRHSVEIWDIAWPWGLVLAVVTTAAVAVAAGRIDRLGEAWYSLGWMLVLVVQSLAPGGSYLVANDWLGWCYSGLGAGSLWAVMIRSSRLQR